MNDTGSSGRRLAGTLVLGFVLGVAAAIAVPKLAGPRLPDAWRGERQLLPGVVRAKQLESDRLVLTVPTAEGTLLATFTEERADIDRLVQEGDSVTLRVRKYEPFVENPGIARVMAVRHAAESAVAETEQQTAAHLGGEVELEGVPADSGPPPRDQ